MNEHIINILATVGVGALILGISAMAFFMGERTEKIPKATTFDEKRQLANILILRHLVDYTQKYPSQRMGQILRNIGIVQSVGVRKASQEDWETPDYHFDYSLIHEEPWVTLERIEKTLANQNNNDIVIKKVNE